MCLLIKFISMVSQIYFSGKVQIWLVPSTMVRIFLSIFLEHR